MTIASEITRLQNDKAAMCTAIENKWVTVGNVTFDDYAACIDAIQSWSGNPTVSLCYEMIWWWGGGWNCCWWWGWAGAFLEWVEILPLWLYDITIWAWGSAWNRWWNTSFNHLIAFGWWNGGSLGGWGWAWGSWGGGSCSWWWGATLMWYSWGAWRSGTGACMAWWWWGGVASAWCGSPAICKWGNGWCGVCKHIGENVWAGWWGGWLAAGGSSNGWWGGATNSNGWNATTYWSWWWGGSSNSHPWGKWKSGAVAIYYPTDCWYCIEWWTITTCGDDTVHLFTSSDTLCVYWDGTPTKMVKYLVVGGWWGWLISWWWGGAVCMWLLANPETLCATIWAWGVGGSWCNFYNIPSCPWGDTTLSWWICIVAGWWCAWGESGWWASWAWYAWWNSAGSCWKCGKGGWGWAGGKGCNGSGTVWGTWWVGKFWYWGWGWGTSWCAWWWASDWGGRGSYNNQTCCNATNYWWWGWGNYAWEDAWDWCQWVVDICYPSDWSWLINSATWWDCCFTCDGFCVHRFTSNWTFTIVS